MNNESTVTCTIRMPQRLKTRLDRSVETLGISLNQLIVDILDRKYHAAGFVEDMKINAANRQLLINIETMNHPPGMPERRFCLHDPNSESNLACYVFGFSAQFMWQLHIDQSEQYSQLEEIGLALIHYYNALGRDITRLEWDQFPTIRTQRILQVQDAKSKSGQFILSPESFLAALKQGEWVDRLERVDGRASSDNQDFFGDNFTTNEETTMTAIALLPMGSGYSTVVLAGQPITGAGVTGGRMFNTLPDLQSWLATLNVRRDLIPQQDFHAPLIIEIGEVPLEPLPQTREKVASVIERAIKQAQSSHATVVFTVHDYNFKITANSDAEEEYARYWDFIKTH